MHKKKLALVDRVILKYHYLITKETNYGDHPLFATKLATHSPTDSGFYFENLMLLALSACFRLVAFDQLISY